MKYSTCSAFFAVLAVGSIASVSSEAGASNLRRNLGSDSNDDCYKCGENDPCGHDHGSGFHKHCSKNKYIQCSNGYCYDMKCPDGTVWDQDEETCGFGKAKLGSCGSCDENPCTKQNIKAGMFYHPHCDKKKKYLQCGAAVGVCFEMDCAEGTRWDEEAMACQSHEGKGKVDLEPCGECDDNPCTKENLKDGKFYHPHCDKKKKYLQCGASVGTCFERSCGSGTKWDQDEESCVAKS